MNNAFSMAYMNVTNTGNETTGLKAFRYLNSTRLEEFPMTVHTGSMYNALSLGPVFGSYLGSAEGSIVLSGDDLYSNPHQVTKDEFESIGKVLSSTV